MPKVSDGVDIWTLQSVTCRYLDGSGSDDTRWTLPACGVFDGDVIRFERSAERLVQRHAGIAEINQRGNLGRLRGHQIPLLLNHIERRGRSSRQLLLFRIQQLLLQNPGLDGGAVTPSSLTHGHQVIGNIHRYLIEILA